MAEMDGWKRPLRCGMGNIRDSFPPQAKCLPINGQHNGHGHPRIAQQDAPASASIQSPLFQAHRHVKIASFLRCRFRIGRSVGRRRTHLVPSDVFDMDCQIFVAEFDIPAVSKPHSQKWRDVQGLFRQSFALIQLFFFRLHAIYYVAVNLSPRRVGHFRDHGFPLTLLIQAEVE